MQRRSDEELIKILSDYLKKYPNTTRNKIRLATGIDHNKLKYLESISAIKLPPKLKSGTSSPWRFYRP